MWDASPEKVSRFQAVLLHWYRRGRRRFSWRTRKRSAYETLIAEMMLRKTDAAKVARLYDDFISRYPTPAALAAADEAELRERIRLLGIADRARLLRLTAQLVNEEHGGRIPACERALMRLPGVGRYTANAVRCFAYGCDVPLVDTNVIRVVDRVFSIRSSKPRPHEDRELWGFAAKLVPARRAVSYNRAVLDFAASVCTAVRPKCAECPLLGSCDYGQAAVTARGEE